MEQQRFGGAVVSSWLNIYKFCLPLTLASSPFSAAYLIPYQVKIFSANSNGAPSVKKRSRPECMCIIDLGHNATHVVPLVGDSIVWSAVKRHVISQRILTNLLKEALSFRQWDMMDEGWLVGHIKEQCCFVASSAGRRGEVINRDSNQPSQWSYAGMVELCTSTPRHKNPLAQEYVLPDYSLATSKGKLGYIKGIKEGSIANDLDSFITGSTFSTKNLVPNGAKKSDEEDGTEEEEEEEDSDDEFDERSPGLPRQSSRPKKVLPVEEDEEMEQILMLERERFQVPEAMFDPGMIGAYQICKNNLLILLTFHLYHLGLDDAPLHQVVESSILACEKELQGPLWANIVLVGGGAKMRGIKERL